MESNLHKGNSPSDNLLYLVDEAGFKHPVYKDQYGRNHMLLYKNLCYLPILKGLYEAGLSNFRIEGAHMTVEELCRVIKVYQLALGDFKACETLYEDLEPAKQDWTLGPFSL